MRYILHIVFSALLIVLTPLLLWFGIWLEHRPRVGPVGNGPGEPPDQLLLIAAMTTLMGIINLPIAIIRYREYRRQESGQDQKTENDDLI